MEATIILPPLELLDAAAAHLVDLASDTSHERALNKGLWNLQSGIEIRSTTAGFLMPSGTRAGIIHRISTVFGCNCEAAAKGNVCWHAAAISILEEAQRYTRRPCRRWVTSWRGRARRWSWSTSCTDDRERRSGAAGCVAPHALQVASRGPATPLGVGNGSAAAQTQARAEKESAKQALSRGQAFVRTGAEMTYEHILLIFLLGLLVGVSIRPLRSALRGLLRAHRAAQPVRKRRRRRISTH
jgi:hypothetical protein